MAKQLLIEKKLKIYLQDSYNFGAGNSTGGMSFLNYKTT